MSEVGKLLARRPRGLLYAVDDVPRPFSLAALGLQHFFVIAPNLTIVLLIGRAAGSSPEMIASQLSWALIVLAIATTIQCSLRTGSGFFIASCNSGIYVSASLAAAAGGLPLVCGMTMLAGLSQIFFSSILVRIRRFFPTEIVALSVIIVGLELGGIGLRRVSTSGSEGLVVGVVTFFVSVALGVYGRGGWRLYSALIGIVSGYVLGVQAGLADVRLVSQSFAGPLFALPGLPSFAFDFDSAYILPFAIAAMAASMKTMGAVVMSSQINDETWVRPDIHLIKKGIAVDGFSTVLSGFLGGVGTNSATSSVGVSQATGATSRVIGFSLSAWMVLFALSPECTRLFVAMPDAVVGGSLVFVASIVTVNGLQILSKVNMDMRRAGVIAFPLILAIAAAANAPPFSLLPQDMKPLLFSALTIAVLSALVVNAFFSIGMARKAIFALHPSRTPQEHIASVRKTLDEWGVAPNVKGRVMLTLCELIDDKCSSLKLRFNGYTLSLDIARQATLAVATSNSFFAHRVGDRFGRSRVSGQTETVSVHYEQ